jgi:hypothetical protein
MAALLVAYGADFNAKYEQSGHSPPSWAITCNALDCARELVKLGAQLDLFCAAGLGLLDHMPAFFDETGEPVPGASRTGSSRFAPDGSRLPCPPPTAGDQVSDSLYITCRKGQTEAVRFLLGKQPDLSFRAYLGATPLHWAYFSGSQSRDCEKPAGCAAACSRPRPATARRLRPPSLPLLEHRLPLPFKNLHRCVGPPRAGNFGLRASVNWTEGRKSATCRANLLPGVLRLFRQLRLKTPLDGEQSGQSRKMRSHV